MTDHVMVRQVLTNFPRELYNRMEGVRELVNEPSTEDFILKLVTGGLILIERELDARKLIITPDLVDPSGQYVGRRTGG